MIVLCEIVRSIHVWSKARITVKIKVPHIPRVLKAQILLRFLSLLALVHKLNNYSV